ncbi:MAG: glycogen synthase GlgA [Oscillospiraceae bacterium]|nr:glycogen synthase GlgA [Oscillospiraceae bacterium]
MNVLFVTSECYPFATSGGLGDVSAALPKALCKKGVDCRVVLPLYGDIKPQYRQNMTFLCSFYVPLAWRSQYCGVFMLKHEGVTCYFLDNEQYFKRTGLYGYFDDGERFAFFSRAVLEMLRHVDFTPQILHTNDWQTALTDVYINKFYRDDPKFYGIKTLATIHNIQYQGKYGREILSDVVGIDPADAAVLEYAGCVNFLKGALESADKISTVSPTYAKELLDPWFAHGLDGILRDKQYKLCGILNGIDTDVYDPHTDPYIAANYSARYPQKKAACKKALLGAFGLEDNGAPVIGLVSRLVSHKGIDLVKHVLEYILLAGIQVVVLGSGDYMYENCFLDFHNKYPTMCGVKIGFVPELARRIYAGADMFLMPSKSEPCGLAQMIALRYGTVPIVRLTGGLRDTVSDSGDGAGNGFTFSSYNAHDMLDACLRAKAVYEDKAAWDVLVRRALRCDFSWGRSADSYIGLYDEMLTLW